MQPVLDDQSSMDAAEDRLLQSVSAFVESRGGFPYMVGGVDLLVLSRQHFCVLVHCEGHAPPLPGAPADG